MLTVDDVCRVSGVEQQTLRNWVAAGLVVPAQPGTTARGQGHRFSSMQAVGLAVAEQLRRDERGCVPSYVGKVVQAFGAVTEGWLLAAFGEGRTHFVTPHQGRPVLAGKRYAWPDVRAVYERVRRAAEAKPARPTAGRRTTGPATAAGRGK